MDVLLHVDVAAAGEIRFLVTDLGGAVGQRTVRVLGAVDESEQVAVVEELEAVHLVDDGDRPAHRLDHPAGELEADVENLGPDVEQQVTRCGGGVVAGAAQLDERVQIFGARPGEQSIPRVGPDRRHHRQVLGRIAEPDRTDQARQIGQRVVYRRLAALVDRGHQEDRGGCQGSQYRLR